MADYEEVSDQEKIKIASGFILHSPPGEFNEVFNDVRVLLDNDRLLKEGAKGAFSQYNKDQFTPCRLGNSEEQTLVTEYGSLGEGRFLDPKSKQTFRYDHLRKEASEIMPAEHSELDAASEAWRSALESKFSQYVSAQYPQGVAVVYGSSGAGGNITLVACIESHKFSPQNFWNGRWRSQWSVTFPETGGRVEYTGILKVQVHYYEDGNVQLVTSKDVKDSLQVQDPNSFASEFIKAITAAEMAYQQAIGENYLTMSDTTFKALRRQLPVTRTKIDWNKILGYKIGQELKHT